MRQNGEQMSQHMSAEVDEQGISISSGVVGDQQQHPRPVPPTKVQPEAVAPVVDMEANMAGQKANKKTVELHNQAPYNAAKAIKKQVAAEAALRNGAAAHLKQEGAATALLDAVVALKQQEAAATAQSDVTAASQM